MAELMAAHDLLALLTPRERHVPKELVAGSSNNIIARELGMGVT